MSFLTRHITNPVYLRELRRGQRSPIGKILLGLFFIFSFVIPLLVFLFDPAEMRSARKKAAASRGSPSTMSGCASGNTTASPRSTVSIITALRRESAPVEKTPRVRDPQAESSFTMALSSRRRSSRSAALCVFFLYTLYVSWCVCASR